MANNLQAPKQRGQQEGAARAEGAASTLSPVAKRFGAGIWLGHRSRLVWAL